MWSFYPHRPLVSAVPKPACPSQWQRHAVTVAGGRGQGNGTDQVYCPHGLFVDEHQTVYAVDWGNHRIMAWNAGATTGEIVAGGNGQGNRLNQLNWPTDVIVDGQTDTLLICDSGNQRIMRCPRCSSSDRRPEVVIENIACYGLTMDNYGSLYVSDTEKNEVRRYDQNGDRKGLHVAGGREEGTKLNQFNKPTHLFVDAQSSLYVADTNNHRVMKWMRGGKEGIVVAGGNGKGGSLTQLSHPKGVWVDRGGHVYVVDAGNGRVIRWEKDAKRGKVIVGENGGGAQAYQLSFPQGIFFDCHGHLYVTDNGNDRIQRFSVIVE